MTENGKAGRPARRQERRRRRLGVDRAAQAAAGDRRAGKARRHSATATSRSPPGQPAGQRGRDPARAEGPVQPRPSPAEDAKLYGKYVLKPGAGEGHQRAVRRRASRDGPHGHRPGAAPGLPGLNADRPNAAAGRHDQAQPRRAAERQRRTASACSAATPPASRTAAASRDDVVDIELRVGGRCAEGQQACRSATGRQERQAVPVHVPVRGGRRLGIRLAATKRDRTRPCAGARRRRARNEHSAGSRSGGPSPRSPSSRGLPNALLRRAFCRALRSRHPRRARSSCFVGRSARHRRRRGPRLTGDRGCPRRLRPTPRIAELPGAGARRTRDDADAYAALGDAYLAEGARDRRRRPTTRARSRVFDAGRCGATRATPRALTGDGRPGARAPRLPRRGFAMARGPCGGSLRLVGRYGVIVDAQIELGRYSEAARDAPADGDPSRTSPPTRACPTSASCTAISAERSARCELAVAAGGQAAENVAYVQTLLGNLEFAASDGWATPDDGIPPGARALPGVRAGRGRARARRRRARPVRAGDPPARATWWRGCRCPST